jgi:hypothetical protein
MVPALKLFAIGLAAGGLLLPLMMAVRVLFRRGITENQMTLAAMTLIVALLGSMAGYAWWLPQSIRPQAIERLNNLKLQRYEIRGTRMPCVGWLDSGFIVSYRLGNEQSDRTGRICKSIGEEWAWYPDTNNLAVR